MHRSILRNVLSIAMLTVSAVGLLPFSVQGEVFWLRPFHGGSGGGSGTGAELERLPGSDGVLHREPVAVNGIELEIQTSRSIRSLAELVTFFQRRYPGADLACSDHTLRVAFRREDGKIERWLLAAPAPKMPVTAFRIVSPETLPPPPAWPKELPRLPGEARAVQVISFHRTGGIYGAFDRAGEDPASRLRSMDSRLRSEGWIPAGNEGKSAIAGKGDLYLQPGPPRKILLVSHGENGMGSYFVRNAGK